MKNKIKIFVAIAMLCMAIAFLPSCSNGIVIPRPVCDVGATLCETLSFLCEFPGTDNPNQLLPDSTLVKIENLNAELQSLIDTLPQ